jgi:hypothetical protein
LYPGSGYLPGGSPSVRVLQRRLAVAGFAPGPVDGRYGPLTERAVIRFQAASGLRVDGIVGPRTLARLTANGAPRRLDRRAGPVRSRSRPGAPQIAGAPAAAPSRPRRVTHAGGASSRLLVLLAGVVMALGVLLRAGRRRRVLGELVAARDRLSPPACSVSDLVAGERYSTDREELLAGAVLGGVDQRGDLSEAFALGVRLEQRGELAVAEVAYRYADQRGDADAACNLGALLQGRGELAGAEAAYRRADQRGHAGAACRLGVLLEDQGDLTCAERAFRRAAQNGDPTGTANLGRLLEHEGALPETLQALRRTRDSGCREVPDRAHAAPAELDAHGERRDADQTGGAGNGR